MGSCVKYTYEIAWSVEDQVYVARIKELPSLASHGNTPEEALKEIRRIEDDEE